MRSLLACVLAVFALPAAADILPSTGSWPISGQTTAADADRFPTASVQVQTGATVLACTNVGPGESFTVQVATSASQVPADVVAFAFAEVGCTGAVSPASNAVTITLFPPEAPTLEE